MKKTAMLEIGTQIWWHGVSRLETGLIREIVKNEYIVSLKNGKSVLVGFLSSLTKIEIEGSGGRGGTDTVRRLG